MDFEREIEETDDEFTNLLDILNADADLLWKQIESNDNQIWRRAFCRALFSLMEGVIFQLKKDILLLREGEGWDLKEEEMKILTEKKQIKDGTGEISTAPFYLPFLQNLVYALEEYAFDNYNFDFKIDRSSPGWSSLKDALTIRNHITHPKTFLELNITDEELKVLKQVEEWFRDTVCDMMMCCAKETFKLVKSLEDNWKRYEAELTRRNLHKADDQTD